MNVLSFPAKMIAYFPSVKNAHFILLFILSTVLLLAELDKTIDPKSVTRVEYKSRNCKVEGDMTLCKEALITFGAILANKDQSQSSDNIQSQLHFSTTDDKKPRTTIWYTPKDCDKNTTVTYEHGHPTIISDPQGRYRCKNVSWRTK